MQITEVEVTPVDQNPLRAYVTIVVDNSLSIRDIKVIRGPDGCFVSMPSREPPLRKEMLELIEETVLTVFAQLTREPVARPHPLA